ncbi:MAG: metal ABC transporter permease [Verrucomicrobiaceae bacterium]|nr:metal ABC transporter permease [Verrucomicrobiaceae bacterium]
MINPFQFDFMWHAALTGSLIAGVCGVLSCFLVLRGWSLMGDAISHAVLPGIVGAYWLGIPLSLGAFVSGLFCAVASGFVKSTTRVKEDTVMGVIFTGLFAIGLVMISKTPSDIHLDHILYGNILGLTRAQIIESVALGSIVLLLAIAKRKDFLLLGFDGAHARVIGLSTRSSHFIMLTLLALTIVTAMKAAGLILAVAMMVMPGATGRLLTKRLDAMLVTAAMSAVLAVWAGLAVAFYVDGAPGACIVLMQAAILFLAWFFSPTTSTSAAKTPSPHSVAMS